MAIVVTIGGVNRTLDAPFDRIKLEAGVSSISRATIVLYDETSAIVVHDRDIVTVDVDGTRVFWGEVSTRDYDLFGGPARMITLNCTDWNTLLDDRLVGCPTGYMWSGPDEQGNYVAVDPSANTSATDAGTVASLFDAYVRLPDGTALDATTHVAEYIPNSYLGANILYWDRRTLRSVLDDLAGIAARFLPYNAPVACWIDAGTTTTPPAVHWQALPSPDPRLVGGGPAALARMLPQVVPTSLSASAWGFSESPDGSTTVAPDKGAKFSFDGTAMPQGVYATGATGFAYNGGVALLGGSGWCGGGAADPSRRQVLQQTDADSVAERDAYAARVTGRGQRATIRGSLSYTDLSASMLFRPGDGLLMDFPTTIVISDSWPIQKVTTTFIGGDGKRVFSIEWGDAPSPRLTQRPRATAAKPQAQPGNAHEIAQPFDSPPKPLGSATFSGQFANQNGEGWAVADLEVDFLVLDWDADYNPIIPPVSTVLPLSTTTDKDGRWKTVVTYGAATYFCQVVATSPVH